MIEIALPIILETEDKSSDFINRIRKNARHLRKFAKRTTTDCFRLFDRDIKEYPLSIDFYAGRYCVHYFLRPEDDDEPSPELKRDAIHALHTIFGATPDIIFHRSRIKRKREEQYEKNDESEDFFVAHEYGIKFKINLVDYLDTGLFLDHRETRKLVSTFCQGKRVLNLFSYTGAFSVHAAMAGAVFTRSVDMSNTYTNWAKDNFLLNNLNIANHEFLREDCLQFLEEETKCYDIIIIDPPTISRSKKMHQIFDIQVDYQFLIDKALKLLSKGGLLFFSTNSRKFHFDETLFPNAKIEDITKKTIPIDFHDQKIHKCWKISV